MPRSIRIEFAGALYHVMARGNRQENIFIDDEDRQTFLRSLAEACAMTGWRVHAWVLMSNHYHILLETPEPNLVAGMKWLQNAYTRRFNARHKQWGRLFGDRYKSVLVEGGGYYYETLMDYIHLNPARAKLIHPTEGQCLLDYPWSSLAQGYAQTSGKRAKWLAGTDGLRAFGFADTVSGRKGFVRRLEDRMLAEGIKKAGIPEVTSEMDKRRSGLQKGWYWGSQEFAERVLKTGDGVFKKTRHCCHKATQEFRAHGEQEALRLLEEGLKVAGLNQKELETLPGSDLVKAKLAEIIWSQTTVNMEWISQTLKMRSATNARQQIRRMKQRKMSKGSERKAIHFTKEFRTWCKQSQMSA